MSGFVGSLSPEQQVALDKLKERLDKELEKELKDVFQNVINGDDALILRFLRARKFHHDNSYEMLYNMLKFRVEFQNIGVSALTPVMCENELKSGKSYFHNYDKEGRPICYVRACMHDPSESDVHENQRYTVLMMEYGKTLLQHPGETVTIVFDMSNTTLKNLDIKSVQFLVNTLQNFYPESLGKILVYNYTWIVNGVWKVVKPWLDPVTAAKVAFIKQEEFAEYIPLENLPTEYGGQDPFTFDANHYRTKFSNALSLRPGA